MKKILSGALFCIATGTASAAQITTDGMLYANKISAYSIVAAQHSISNAVLGAYDYYGLHVGKAASHNNTDHTSSDAAHMYGTFPLYGSMPLYGEWNDDGSAVRGHSGGDTIAPTNMNTWARWTHGRADEKFRNFKKVRQNNDIILVAIGTNKTDIGAGWISTGAFGGYTGGRTHNTYIDLDQQGGYFGLYGSYNIHRMRTSMLATVGKMNSDIPRKFGGDSLDNTWANLTALTTFDILPTPSFTLQPGLRLGYTWVKSSNYTSLERIYITNDNFNFFLISPQLRAIKHMGHGWFGAAHIRYMWQMKNGGDARTSTGAKLHDLKMGNYTEYGIGLEKLFGQINTSIDISRQDGARRGWAGGIHLKYVF